MRRLLKAGCLAAALATLWAPAGAIASAPIPLLHSLQSHTVLQTLVRARTAKGHRPRSFHSAFGLRTGNGYLLAVLGEGENVLVLVGRKHLSSLTAYLARGTVTPNRIKASFGKFGRVDMTFRPSSNRLPPQPHRDCRGRSRFIDRRGVFVGTVHFTGEDRYIAVRAHRASGRVKRVASKCERHHARHRIQLAIRPSQGGREVSFLSADWRQGVDSAQFLALDERRTGFIASAERSEGRVAIEHLAIEFRTPPGVFTVDDALTSAQVSPPAPFQGTGTYTAAPDGTKTWTGSLSVSFPGLDLPLTGPPFEATVGTAPSIFGFFF